MATDTPPLKPPTKNWTWPLPGLCEWCHRKTEDPGDFVEREGQKHTVHHEGCLPRWMENYEMCQRINEGNAAAHWALAMAAHQKTERERDGLVIENERLRRENVQLRAALDAFAPVRNQQGPWAEPPDPREEG